MSEKYKHVDRLVVNVGTIGHITHPRMNNLAALLITLLNKEGVEVGLMSHEDMYGGVRAGGVIFDEFHTYEVSVPHIPVAGYLVKPNKLKYSAVGVHGNSPCPCGSGRKYRKCCK